MGLGREVTWTLVDSTSPNTAPMRELRFREMVFHDEVEGVCDERRGERGDEIMREYIRRAKFLMRRWHCLCCLGSWGKGLFGQCGRSGDDFRYPMFCRVDQKLVDISSVSPFCLNLPASANLCIEKTADLLILIKVRIVGICVFQGGRSKRVTCYGS